LPTKRNTRRSRQEPKPRIYQELIDDGKFQRKLE
jgi:hypothetical protein